MGHPEFRDVLSPSLISNRNSTCNCDSSFPGGLTCYGSQRVGRGHLGGQACYSTHTMCDLEKAITEDAGWGKSLGIGGYQDSKY